MDANAAACKFYQYSLEEMKELKIWDINALGRSKTQKQMTLAVSGEQTDFTFQHQLASGEIRDVHVYSGTLQAGNQKLLHSIVIDITERKRAEKKAEEYPENLKAIFDSAPNILLLVNDEMRVEMINRKGVAVTGKEKGELIGNLCGDVLSCTNSFRGEGCGGNPDCFQCRLRFRVETTFKTGKACNEEEAQMTFLINGNETSMDFLISTALLDINGINKVLLSLTDITERKKAEERLRESEAMHKELFDNSPTPLLIQDFSAVEDRVKEMKKEKGVTDLKSYLQNNTDEVLRLAAWLKFVKVIKRPVTCMGIILQTISSKITPLCSNRMTCSILSIRLLILRKARIGLKGKPGILILRVMF